MGANLKPDLPAYWLVKLERSVREGDYEAAAEAKRELLRLGIDVSLRLRFRRAEAEVTA